MQIELKANLTNLNIMLLNARTLLLIDAAGAGMTSFATFYLLAGQRIETGMPVDLLYAMAILAACFACFDVLAVVRRMDPAIPLRVIACANLSYCLLAFVSMCAHRTSVTYLGVAYFCIEIAIVISLAVWEWTISFRSAVP